jgi:hypothetical protein
MARLLTVSIQLLSASPQNLNVVLIGRFDIFCESECNQLLRSLYSCGVGILAGLMVLDIISTISERATIPWSFRFFMPNTSVWFVFRGNSLQFGPASSLN